MNSRSRIFIVGVCCVVGFGHFKAACAQVIAIARVSAIERVVEKQSAGAGPFVGIKAGATLGRGDVLQTGKRSKADLHFPHDKSLVRLGQLSTVIIDSGHGERTSVRLRDGRILFVKVRGAAPTRVLTGTGVAAIKGSVAVIEDHPDGSFEFSLYLGEMSIQPHDRNENPVGPPVDLKPGQQVRVRLGGILSEIGLAPPLGARTDVTQTPQDAPFAGSSEQLLDRLAPAQVGVDSNLAISRDTVNVGNPYLGRDGGIPPTPGPTFPPVGNLVGSRRIVRLNSQLGGPTGAAQSSGMATTNSRSMAAQATGAILLAQADVRPNPATGATNVAEQTVVGAGTDPDLGPALKHFDEADAGRGRLSGVDYRAVGLIGSDDLRGVFGRVHLFGREGRWGGDLVVSPQYVKFNSGAGRVERETVTIPQAMVSYQGEKFAVIAGRQRYLAGPVRASFYGSMVRSGGREIMDALRIAPKLGRDVGLEVSYLYDAFPRHLPFNIGGRQEGVYARLSTNKRFGNFGLNVLRYFDSPVPDRTGISLDFALPVVRNKVELYGELGRDPFRRRLRTFGLTFPVLYQKTNFDLYIEHARLSNSATSAGMPGEWAVRVYRPINDNIDLVGAYNHYDGFGSQVVFGVSVGGRTLFRSSSSPGR